MKRKISQLNFVEFTNTFSIWVLLGAIFCYIFYSKLHLHSVDYTIAVICGLGCWWVYTLDHLWDGLKAKQNTTSLRHFIHNKYAKPITYVLVFLFVVLLIAVLVFVSINIVKVGILVAGLTGLHFLINHLFAHLFKKGLFFKEGMIAIVVTIGFCLLPGFEQSINSFSLNWMLDALSFFTLSLANLLIFTVYDYNLDKQNEFASSSQVYGIKPIKGIATILIIVSILINGVSILLLQKQPISFLVVLAMQLVLAAIFLWPSYFNKNERFRFWGDFIYVLPVFALPFL